MSKDKKNKKEKDNNKKKISYLKTKISLSFAQTTETAQSSQEASWCCPLEALNRNKLNSWWKKYCSDLQVQIFILPYLNMCN